MIYYKAVHFATGDYNAQKEIGVHANCHTFLLFIGTHGNYSDVFLIWRLKEIEKF